MQAMSERVALTGARQQQCSLLRQQQRRQQQPGRHACSQAASQPGSSGSGAPREKPRTSPAPSSVAAAPRNLDLKWSSSRRTQPCQARSTSCCSSSVSCRVGCASGGGGGYGWGVGVGGSMLCSAGSRLASAHTHTLQTSTPFKAGCTMPGPARPGQARPGLRPPTHPPAHTLGCLAGWPPGL